jgi:hypothetical protein
LSSISIKGDLLNWYKDLHWGRWLKLEYCIFDGHYHTCWNDKLYGCSWDST